MGASPRISIVIPALQEEKLIGQALEQFPPRLRELLGLEIIVSDGGSRDRTLELARAHADLVVGPSNGERENISIGRNRGARAARGEFLMFFNADVLIPDPERFIPEMIGAVDGNGTVAATCNVLIYPGEENARDRVFHRVSNWYFWLLNKVGMGMGRGECHVLTREVFERIGGYQESLAAGEDYELFVRLRRLGSIDFRRDLKVYESPRRYRKFGYVRIISLWFLNALSVLIFRHAMVKEWKPVR